MTPVRLSTLLPSAVAALATSLAIAAPAAPAVDLQDYGMGAFPDVAAWQAAGGAPALATAQADVPMDYGLGAMASVADWMAAGSASGAPRTPTALAGLTR